MKERYQPKMFPKNNMINRENSSGMCEASKNYKSLNEPLIKPRPSFILL